MPRPALRVLPRWPLLLLLVGLGCTAVAVVEVERGVRTNRVVADGALRGYAGFAAWSLTEHLAEALRADARELLGDVNHGAGFHTSRRIPDAGELPSHLPTDPTCRCPRPMAGPAPSEYYGFRLGADTMAVRPFGTGHVPSSQPTHLSVRQRWLHDTLTSVAHRGRSPWDYGLIATRREGRSELVAMTLMPTSWGDTIVYAASYAPAGIDSVLAAALDDRTLLPETLVAGRRNRDVLAAEFLDAGGRTLYRAESPDQWVLDATAGLPTIYGGITVHVQIRPELADQLVIGGLPRSRLPLVLGLLGLAAGLTIIAGLQLRQEASFARDRSDFVASVSHELRTPLAQIRLATDTLLLGREPDPARRDATLALIDRESTRLQHLVEGVLRFSRGDSGSGEEAFVELDPAVETALVVEEFAPLALARGATIRCESEPTPRLRLRAGSLRQILLNLLDNAVKYGPTGQRVLVSLAGTSEGGVRLAVTDAGPGVPHSERERIWRAFERGAAAKHGAVGGSGIGLTVVRDIVDVHGGRAWVDDAPGGGALFVIHFPGSAR